MKGQTLVESLLALSVLIVVLSSIAVTVTKALSNSNYSKSQTQATQYAQEGMEIVRQIRDRDYNNFITKNSSYCLGENESLLVKDVSQCSSPNLGTFIRTVSVQQSGCAPGIAQVTVNVSWNDGKCSSGTYCHASKVTSCLSSSNPIQSP